MRNRIRIPMNHRESISIRRVSNGYIVFMPMEDDYSEFGPPEPDLRKKILDPRFIYKMITLVTKAKNGEEVDFEKEFPEDGPEIAGNVPGGNVPGGNVPGGNVPGDQPGEYIFATWEEASAFIKSNIDN